MSARSLALGFVGGLVVGLLVHLLLRPPSSPERASSSANDAQARLSAPVDEVGPIDLPEYEDEPPAPSEPENRLKVQLDALKATHESLDDRAREAERTVENLERRIQVLEQELVWARGQEQEYIRTYPDDDIKEVIRTRARAIGDFGIELDVRETHEIVLLYRRLNQAAAQARAAAKGDHRLRMRLTDEAKREFTRSAEVLLPPEKVRRIKERWDYLWR